MHDVRRLTNPHLRVLGVLPTLYDGRTAHARAVLGDISGRYGLDVLVPPVPRSVRFAEAPTAGRSILTTAGSSRGADAYRAHARHLAGLPPADSLSEPGLDEGSEVDAEPTVLDLTDPVSAP